MDKINCRGLRLLPALMGLCLLLLAKPVFAYHYLYQGTGAQLKWQSLPVNVIADGSPSTFPADVAKSTTPWNTAPAVQQVFGSVQTSSVDFTAANLGSAWGNLTGDGKVEIVYDADGSILQKLGVDPRIVNGLTGLPMTSGKRTALNDAYFVLNGARSNFDAQYVMTHEFGHMLGLAHSAIGLSLFFPSEVLDPISIQQNVPVMFPISITTRHDLAVDDIAAISALYPSANFASTFGTIQGKVTRLADGTPVTGAYVRAVPVNSASNDQQIGRFTGYDAKGDGTYIIQGVPPGSYKMVVESVTDEAFSSAAGRSSNALGSFGPPPTRLDKDFFTEYHHAPAVESNPEKTLPDKPEIITVAAGGTTNGVDFQVSNCQLAFVVDTTGSMGIEIVAVRAILTAFVSAMDTLNKTLGITFPETAIITFGGPTGDTITVNVLSRDPTTLKTVIGGFTASSGGDCPEGSNAALLTAGRILQPRGVAMLFTDADSHANGPTREAVENLYRPKALKLVTLLSGTCTGSISAVTSDVEAAVKARPPIPSATNYQTQDLLPTPDTLGVLDAVSNYSSMTTATGGLFVPLPGIKTGNQLERQRYINIGTNIAISSVTSAVGLVVPGDGPQGSTLTVEINGANTNFQVSSDVSFSGAGISILSKSVISPERLTARIAIAADTVLGFHDVTVTTNLGAGKVEAATGTGAFNVVAAPTRATVLGINPAIGALGQTLNVSISAANTTFAAGTSVASFGTGVKTNSTSVISATEAIANVTVDMAATTGLRDVTVTTGTEVASENVPGPFLVIEPVEAAALPTVNAVSPATGAGGQILDVMITGTDTNFVDGDSVASFSGAGITVVSTKVTTPQSATAHLSIAPDAAPGFRDVFVTTVGETAAALRAFQVTPLPPPVITSALAAQVQVKQPFAYQIVASNFATSFAAANLPLGLSISPATGLISGTPTVVGTFNVVLTAANLNGAGTATLGLVVTPPPPPVITAAATVPQIVAGTGEAGEVTLTRSGDDLSTQLIVEYAIKGSAVNGSDYVLLKGVKKMKPGKASVKIKVKPIGSGAGSGVKRVVTLVLQPGDGYTVGTTGKIKVKIVGQ